MRTIYCLSGLGVDETAFSYFVPKNVTLVHIAWIDPKKSESLKDYAKRLFDSANLPNEYLLLGVSFGGMIAQEFAKIRQPQLLFLISTVPSKDGLPLNLRIGGKMGIHKILPAKVLTKTTPLTYFLFGTKTSEHKALLNQILKKTDHLFLKWAMNAIVQWENDVKVDGKIIHGGKDRILPKKTDIDYLIADGGHFLIATHGKQVSEIVDRYVAQLKEI